MVRFISSHINEMIGETRSKGQCAPLAANKSMISTPLTL